MGRETAWKYRENCKQLEKRKGMAQGKGQLRKQLLCHVFPMISFLGLDEKQLGAQQMKNGLV